MTRSDVTEVQEPVDGVPDLPERTDLADREGESAETDSTAGSPAGQPPRRRFRYTLPGAWTALAFACLSFTPSLVPRPGGYQGVVCGLGAAIGYGLGVLGARVWREFANRSPRPTRHRSWQVFGIVGSILLVVSYLLGRPWCSSAWWQPPGGSGTSSGGWPVD